MLLDNKIYCLMLKNPLGKLNKDKVMNIDRLQKALLYEEILYIKYTHFLLDKLKYIIILERGI